MHGHSDTESEREDGTEYKNGVISCLSFSRPNLSIDDENHELVRDQDALHAVEQIKSVDLLAIYEVCFR